MKPETAREVELARAAYIKGRQDERTYWREWFKPVQSDVQCAATMYPMPTEAAR